MSRGDQLEFDAYLVGEALTGGVEAACDCQVGGVVGQEAHSLFAARGRKVQGQGKGPGVHCEH